MKRNDVVSEKSKDGWCPYGRVWKTVDKDHVLVIFCTKDFGVYRKDDLEVHDYKGRWNERYTRSLGSHERYLEMPTLRQLKQAASHYAGRTVWRK